jgi:putative oligomerization/nucleic acid binding protein/phospholipase D-like protein
VIATTFGAGQVAYSILWFALFFVEIWLMISIFIDIFRSHDMKGWAKALWLALVIIFPLIGIVLYLIFRGDKMRVHQAQAAVDQDTAWHRYSQHLSDGHGSKTDQLVRLAQLRDRGDISADEFERLKAEILDQGPSGPRPS